MTTENKNTPPAQAGRPGRPIIEKHLHLGASLSMESKADNLTDLFKDVVTFLEDTIIAQRRLLSPPGQGESPPDDPGSGASGPGTYTL